MADDENYDSEFDQPVDPVAQTAATMAVVDQMRNEEAQLTPSMPQPSTPMQRPNPYPPMVTVPPRQNYGTAISTATTPDGQRWIVDNSIRNWVNLQTGEVLDPREFSEIRDMASRPQTSRTIDPSYRQYLLAQEPTPTRFREPNAQEWQQAYTRDGRFDAAAMAAELNRRNQAAQAMAMYNWNQAMLKDPKTAGPPPFNPKTGVPFTPQQEKRYNVKGLGLVDSTGRVVAPEPVPPKYVPGIGLVDGKDPSKVLVPSKVTPKPEETPAHVLSLYKTLAKEHSSDSAGATAYQDRVAGKATPENQEAAIRWKQDEDALQALRKRMMPQTKTTTTPTPRPTVAAPAPAPPSVNAQEVIRMTKDGKRAVFDAQTKQFIRYAD